MKVGIYHHKLGSKSKMCLTVFSFGGINIPIFLGISLLATRLGISLPQKQMYS